MTELTQEQLSVIETESELTDVEAVLLFVADAISAIHNDDGFCRESIYGASKTLNWAHDKLAALHDVGGEA